MESSRTVTIPFFSVLPLIVLSLEASAADVTSLKNKILIYVQVAIRYFQKKIKKQIPFPNIRYFEKRTSGFILPSLIC